MSNLEESFTSDEGIFFVKLGSCWKPHGIKGGFTLFLYNTDQTVLKKKLKILLMPESAESSIKPAGETYEIKTINIGNKAILYIDGVNDRNMTEAMIPFSIYCDRESFPEKKEGEIYLSDLIGLEAIDHVTGKSYGHVDAVSDNSVQDIIHITGKEDFEIVFVDQFVHEIDIDNKKILITKPVYT